MLKQDVHPSDQELLLTADGELPTHRANRVRAHLAACWDCRARMAEIERTITDFVRARHDELDSRLPPIAGPRSLLKAQLAELARQRPRESRLNSIFSREGWELRGRAIAVACSCVLFVALATGILYWHGAQKARLGTDAALLPNPGLTPGATRPVAIGDLCSNDHDEVIRPVSGTLQQKVFQEYGIRDKHPEKYEVDYLITPGLGGADDIRNLWPEPRYDTRWNSFVKDQLEDYLHQAVCGGKISLSTAQKDVASDWISAYKKYFHTDQPLARAAAIASS